MEYVKVPACKADSVSFAPYGHIMGKPDRPADYEDCECTFWHDIAPFGIFSAEQTVNYYLLKKVEPSTDKLIKVATDEAYFNIDGRRIYYFVADSLSDGSPDLSTIKAFYFEGPMCPILKAHVWRTPPYSSEAENLILLVMDGLNVYFGEEGMKRDLSRIKEVDLPYRCIISK